jgi:cobalt-zinc-cadmium efflux system outer membrane protein
VIGKPGLPLQVVEGNLETDLPQVNEEQIVEAIAKESPAVRIAAISTARAQAMLERTKAEPVPDLQLRVGAEYFGEQLPGINRPIGWEGIAEVGVTLPLWNRNQGNIAAARQDVDRAQREETRVELTLRERTAAVLDQYATARIVAEEYRQGILPRAKEAYSLLIDNTGKCSPPTPSSSILNELFTSCIWNTSRRSKTCGPPALPLRAICSPTASKLRRGRAKSTDRCARQTCP